ncbi:MAG: hypothetical protein AB1673_09110 [Actinomycetota bacterium]
MILVLVPVAAVVVGLALWVALKGMGALTVPGADHAGGGAGGYGRERFRDQPRPTSLREWVDRVPFGVYVGIIAVSAVWVLAWLIALIVGLSFLT